MTFSSALGVAYFYRGHHPMTAYPWHALFVDRVVWSDKPPREDGTRSAVAIKGRSKHDGKAYTVTTADTMGAVNVKIWRRGTAPQWIILEDD